MHWVPEVFFNEVKVLSVRGKAAIEARGKALGSSFFKKVFSLKKALSHLERSFTQSFSVRCLFDTPVRLGLLSRISP